MQRKPTNFPVANCNIKMPDCLPANMEPVYEEESEQRRLQLINFGHSQWGFNNWSWSVTKQELDFVEFANGVYTAGVATFVAVTLRALDVRREAVGYAGAAAASKAAAISRARKSSVVDALRETLLGLGGAPAAALAELLAAGVPAAHPAPAVAPVLPTPAAPPAAAPVPLAAALPPERPRALPDIAPVPAKPGPPPPPPTRPLPIAGPPPPTRPLPVAAALPMPAAAPAGSARAARPTPGPAPRPANEGREGASRETSPAAEARAERRPRQDPAEEARAERRRRQRQAQEEFRIKQQLKQAPRRDDKPEAEKNTSSFDKLLMEIPTQDIVIEHTGGSGAGPDAGKRKSPAPDAGCKRRSANFSRLDIVQSD